MSKIKPKFIIGDVVRHKDSNREHLITGVDVDAQTYSIDGDNKMIEWYFDFDKQDDYCLVSHKSVQIGNVIYE